MNNKRKAFTLAEGVIRHCERSVAIQNKGISPSPQPSPQRVEGEITLNPCLRKCAFTLAEGATHVDMSNGYRKAAFTLAEGVIRHCEPPSRGMSASERRAIMPIMNIAQESRGCSSRLACVEQDKQAAKCRLLRTQQEANCERFRLMRGDRITQAEI